MPLSLGEAMLDRNSIPHRSSAGLVLPVLALAAAGILLILIAGSLGATTSGRGVLKFWPDTSGHGRDTVTRTSELPERLVGSGAEVDEAAPPAADRGTNPGQPFIGRMHFRSEA